ncbi:type VII secretion protein EccCa [Solicola gregarius]|uniref:Type VII secretion protein EccCa n=1 Tax=Solicola gregarius TaxID=2908642 RepID=A0AA46YN17_9ACTN|nr:type VII secretion protein EccCa [Solicola gregarius]UYM06283.1 type VII secretion protein EccCa [Solicola gregarius]
MTTTVVKRPPRTAPPTVPENSLSIAEPPAQQQAPPAATGAAMILMPVVGGIGSLTLALSNAGHNRLIAVGALAALVGSITVGLVMILSQRTGPRRLLRQARERYLNYIDDLRHTLRRTVAAQRDLGAWCHPAPEVLPDLVRNDRRRWERRPGHADYLCLRVGVGDQPVQAGLRLEADTGPLNEFDPLCLDAAVSLLDRYSIIQDAPIPIDLRGVGMLGVRGDPDVARRLVTAMACQLVAFHRYRDVRLAVVRSVSRSEAWDWVKWLPHVQAGDEVMDGDLPARLVAASVADAFTLLQPHIERRIGARSRERDSDPLEHVVVIIDTEQSASLAPSDLPDVEFSLAELGIHLIVIQPPQAADLSLADEWITVRADGSATLEARSAPFDVDRVPIGCPTVIARLLAPLRLAADLGASEPRPEHTVDLPEILGVDDPGALRTDVTWQARSPRDLLRVPIGVGTDGRVVPLDLKESAHGGMGPHGMVVGATGSGKSEMLRTLVASLVIGHAPDRLALLLVDFKGGATFAALKNVPHLAGMITNLQDDLSLVDRMYSALFGEILRRQELLKQRGNLPNVSAYQALIDSGDKLEPLPHLLVIIDEFAELLTAKPDFADLFVAIGRIGRSVGVHLLLATQKLEMGKIRGLESHLSYRICLRTFSESESRDAIGTPDAYHLPSEPGSGYLKVDTSVFDRFKGALVSAPYAAPSDAPKTEVPVVPYVAVNGIGAWIAQRGIDRTAASTDLERVEGAGTDSRSSVLDVLCERLVAAGVDQARPVWLEPLPYGLPLDRAQDPERRGEPATIEAALGVVDDPSRQRQFPLTWDFAGADGNLVIAGAPQTGKSTLVRTLVSSLALRYAPGDVAFYCVDYGGGSLRGIENLPHVASVATRLDPERIGRTVSEVVSLIERREEQFRDHGLDSMSALRDARADGRFGPDLAGDIFLIVDGWGSFREDFESLEFAIGEIAARGSNYGVHVILTVAQNLQVRIRMQSSFGGRLELRLTEAYESGIGRKLMEALPKDVPGRGLVHVGDGLVFHAALPRIDGHGTTDDLPAAQRQLMEVARARWTTAVQPVEVLPQQVPVTSLPVVERGDLTIPIGLSERNLEPAGVSLFGADPHLLVYGDGEAGKTNTLRLLLRQLTASRTTDELAFIVVDYRRSLLDAVPPEYLAAYCTNDQQTAATAADVAGAVRDRLPPDDVTAEQVRRRSWWNGVDVVILVDDYDLVANPSGNPLHALLEFLPQGRDLGLHLVVARRTGGLSRAIFEPFLQRLNDLQTPGVVLSGDRTEGRLVNGVVARRLPAGRAIYAPRGGVAGQLQIALPDDYDSLRSSGS